MNQGEKIARKACVKEKKTESAYVGNKCWDTIKLS